MQQSTQSDSQFQQDLRKKLTSGHKGCDLIPIYRNSGGTGRVIRSPRVYRQEMGDRFDDED